MKKLLSGIVVTNSAKDTSVVEVTVWKTHRLFRKRYKTNKRFVVHNAGNEAKVGQVVNISPCRPISKLKKWTIVGATKVSSVKKPASRPKTKTAKEKI